MAVCIIMTLVGFISGSVMYSYLIPKLLYGINIVQNSEDGNPGSANVMASAGISIGITCLLLDIMKAFIPVYSSVKFLSISGVYITPVIIAPVLGHAFSPFLRFKGGKAVAASIGALLGILSISNAVFVIAIALIIFRFIIVIRPDSSKITAAFVISCFVLAILEPLFEVRVAVFIISLVICYKHYIQPNKGEFSIKIGLFSISFENKKIKLKKV